MPDQEAGISKSSYSQWQTIVDLVIKTLKDIHPSVAEVSIGFVDNIIGLLISDIEFLTSGPDLIVDGQQVVTHCQTARGVLSLNPSDSRNPRKYFQGLVLSKGLKQMLVAEVVRVPRQDTHHQGLHLWIESVQ